MVRWWAVAVPAVGIAVMAGLPFVWSIQSQRDERTAIEVIFHVHEAQRQFRSVAGGYAVSIDALAAGCPGTSADAVEAILDQAQDAGYTVAIRMREGATASGRDCRGRPMAPDYYIAAEPIPSATFAQRAYASLADQRIYVFFDRVAPRERDIAAGLPTPLETLDDFRIP